MPWYVAASPFTQIDPRRAATLTFRTWRSPRHEATDIKIVVIGGSGRVGEKLVYFLRQDDYRVLEASPTHGVDAVTGQGLDRALDGAEVVVDCSNAPELDGDAAVRFFGAAGRRLIAAGRAR
jgi:uncharacterized protein YbjT (DUF2867 family)